MSTNTEIQWTDATWNPVRGCSRVSPGCDNCYAMKQAHRFAGPGKPYDGLTVLRPKNAKRPGVDWSGRVRLVPKALSEPAGWKTPQNIFVNSMSDLFHEGLKDTARDEVFHWMGVCDDLGRGHTFQILTKRPLSAARYFKTGSAYKAWNGPRMGPNAWPARNVHLGVSVEDRAAKVRIDELRDIPAILRFLSIEPLLEDLGEIDLRGIGWVIVGGESGPGARPCALEWIERIVEQCRAANVPVFVKQLGARVVSEQRAYLRPDLSLGTDEEAKAELGVGSRWLWQAGLAHKKGGDMSEWPEALQVREFPEART